MTDDIKNLLDAPWEVFSSPDDEITVIENESGRVLAELDDVKTANRIARLPELYDALEEACELLCHGCLSEGACKVSYTEKPEEHCCTASWIKLLRKVRAGK